ncbi:MAG: TIR domain-containing protein, partial [Thermoguttaceae bacterium]
PSIKEMARGVVKCRKTLLILTPDYLESGWTEIENIMLQTLDPANRELRLIPMLKKECKKPLRIGAFTHIDFTDSADLDLAWRQLFTALGKPPEPEPPKEPRHEEWFLAHPYPMPPNFIGRVAERAMLTRWLNTDAEHPLLSLRALGGFGKSALAWHWLTHDVAPAAWPRVVWWSFYEGDASFDHFLAETLLYLSDGKIKPDNLSVNEVRILLEMLHAPGTLLVLDGFERVLRAFGGLDAAYRGDEVVKSEANERDCISPLAEDFLRHLAVHPHLLSKVMLTTRLCPRVLEARGGGFLQGCREEELMQMQPNDAVEFFRAQGIRGTHTEIEQACEPYGYHPLSLRLLAGLIVGNFQQPGDIAAAKWLDVSGDLVQRQHHVLEMAYNSLIPTRQVLLGHIACFRSPVKYEALKALAQTESPRPDVSLGEGQGEGSLDANLRDLVTRGLLHHDTKEGRFDLHPIVRRYAYNRLTATDRTAAHTRLCNYFAAIPPPEKVMRLEDLAPVIELYHHTVRAGQFDEAFTIYRNRLNELYYQLGSYQLIIDLLRALFPHGEDSPPCLKDESAQALTLAEMANSYGLNGQPRHAVPLYERQIAIREKQGVKRSVAIGLGAVASISLMPIGALRAAEINLHRSIALCPEFNNKWQEAAGHAELGRLLAYRGGWAESEAELATAAKLFEERKAMQFLGVTLAYRFQSEMLLLRHTVVSSDRPFDIRNSLFDISPARRALELADETSRTFYPHPRNYVRAHWLLGAAHRVIGQTAVAEHHLNEALERCRRINSVDAEADILIDLARLRADTGAPDEAQKLAYEALVITEHSEYVLQGADAHLELAKLALARGDKAAALKHAQESRRLATCDGPPDYTYKVAYDEAGALLAKLE